MNGEAWKRLRKTADSISDMSIRGAGKIARAAANALADLARDWDGQSPEDLLADISKAASILHETRPSAVSLRNGILLTLRDVEKQDSIDGMKELLMMRSDEFISSSHLALEKISQFGAKRIRKGSTVLTHCNSSAALSVIYQAFKDGRVDEVYSTESRPWRQGHITARWLAEREVPVTMIVDSAVRHFMNDMDIVCVGADTITANGAVINKIGTSQLALAAHEARTPFIVCAETYKFSMETLMGSLVEIEDRGPKEVADPLEPDDFPGVRFKNPVFDVTPPEYINSIVTEMGVISPYMATEIIRGMFQITGPISMERGNEDHKWFREM